MGSTPNRLAAVVALVASTLLVACGSDGGGGGTDPDATVTVSVQFTGDGAGAISSNPAGLSCASDDTPCTGTFEEGTSITLTATATGENIFTGWSGPCSGTGNCTFTVTTSTTVQASFDDVELATQTVGSGGGTVTATDGNLVLDIPSGALAGDQAITVRSLEPNEVDAAIAEQVADVGISQAYEFGPDGLTFQTPAEVRVVTEFVVDPTAFEIDVGLAFLGSSDGTLEPVPATVQIDPSSGAVTLVGEVRHFSSLVVTDLCCAIEVQPLTGPDFPSQLAVGESFPFMAIGAVRRRVGNFPPLERSVLRAEMGAPVAATFESPVEGELFIDTSSGTLVTFGDGGFTCTAVGTGSWGFRVELSFEGGPGGASNLRISRPLDCVAPPPVTLTVGFTGSGSGVVTSSPAGVNCATADASCATEFPEGTVVTLTATADQGSVFCGWSNGDSDPSTNVNLDFGASITACFDTEQQTEVRLRIDASSIQNTNGSVAEGPQTVDLLDADGNVVGSVEVAFSGQTFVDPNRNVIGFGTDGRIEVDMSTAMLPEGAPAPDQITVEINGQDNSSEVQVGYETRDGQGNTILSATQLITNGLLNFVAAQIIVFFLVTQAIFFDFLLSIFWMQ